MSIGNDAQRQKLKKAVANFSKYSDEVESIFNKPPTAIEKDIPRAAIRCILNGEAASALRNLVPIDVRKEAGIFFTSTNLADRVAKHLGPLLRTGVELCDPACGAGNLLIACCQYLPCGESFDETARIWSRLVKGYDLYPQFIRAARLRLAVAAANRHSKEQTSLEKIKADWLFQGLKTGDVFSRRERLPSKCVVVNPPFGYMHSPEDCTWGEGKIQIAGWFMEKLLRMANEGQHLVAVLPDVLNSGTRYKRWRNMVCSLVSDIMVEPIGRFDADTDVDVVIVHLVAGRSKNGPPEWPDNLPQAEASAKKVCDFFEIHVGAVVPHRDPIEGASYPYIHARTALAWQTLDSISETCQSIRRVFSPPFVVVHRTSSPSDKHRCVGTIVNELHEVAVENHLIVLLPNDSSLVSCEQLLDSLKRTETDDWLNRRIRCRHLTVSALRDLPYYK